MFQSLFRRQFNIFLQKSYSCGYLLPKDYNIKMFSLMWQHKKQWKLKLKQRRKILLKTPTTSNDNWLLTTVSSRDTISSEMTVSQMNFKDLKLGDWFRETVPKSLTLDDESFPRKRFRFQETMDTWFLSDGSTNLCQVTLQWKWQHLHSQDGAQMTS